ncbi:HCNGP-like protein-domain-containing protein [Trametes elegans]|nr:HCNGP-like protein-domain-containing protein [Trametes elegans]
MRGLVAYDDDPLSDHEDQNASSTSRPSPTAKHTPGGSSARKSTTDGSQLNARPVTSSDAPPRSANNHTTSRPAVIIRRHAPTKPHLRTRLPEDVADEPGPSSSGIARTSSQDQPTERTGDPAGAEPSDELTRIRQLLRPPPIPGVEDWGIPPEPETPCDEAIKAKITSFLALKRDPHNPRHFNDSLMANRAFRNPHLYAKLVEFVDVDERTTNFPTDVWDPLDVKDEWYADRIAEAQKVRSEATAASQSSAKRFHIDFTSNATSSSAHAARHPPIDPKAARYQPYAVPPRGGAAHKDGVLGGGYGKGRGRSRWG